VVGPVSYAIPFCERALCVHMTRNAEYAVKRALDAFIMAEPTNVPLPMGLAIRSLVSPPEALKRGQDAFLSVRVTEELRYAALSR
jgi:hypothetical protein